MARWLSSYQHALRQGLVRKTSQPPVQAANSSEILADLRGKLGDPKIYSHWRQVQGLYAGILEELWGCTSFQEALQVGVPCFEYLRGHLAGLELGLLRDCHRGWERLWLFYCPVQVSQNDKGFSYEFIHIGSCERGWAAFHSIRDRGDAFSRLTGVYFARCSSRVIPLVSGRPRLEWKGDWTGQYRILSEQES